MHIECTIGVEQATMSAVAANRTESKLIVIGARGQLERWEKLSIHGVSVRVWARRKTMLSTACVRQ